MGAFRTAKVILIEQKAKKQRKREKGQMTMGKGQNGKWAKGQRTKGKRKTAEGFWGSYNTTHLVNKYTHCAKKTFSCSIL